MHVAAFVCVADNREVLFDTRTKAVMAQTDQPNDVKTKVSLRVGVIDCCCWARAAGVLTKPKNSNKSNIY